MSESGIFVRAARVEDVPEILALERAVMEAPHWAEIEYESIVRGGATGDLRRCLLVAEVAERIAGFAVGKVVVAAGVSELESIAVRAAMRRYGVGRALCGGVIKWCGAQGADGMELEVRSASAGARALYAGLGFVVQGVRKSYYSEPDDDAVLMRLDFGNCG